MRRTYTANLLDQGPLRMKIKPWQLFACVSLFAIFTLLSPYFGFGSTILKILALTPFFFTICLATCIVDEYGSNQSLNILAAGFVASIGLALAYTACQTLLPDSLMRVCHFGLAAGTSYGISHAATHAFEKFRKRLPSNSTTAFISSAAALPGLFLRPGIAAISIMCALWLLMLAFAITRPAPLLIRRRIRSTS